MESDGRLTRRAFLEGTARALAAAGGAPFLAGASGAGEGRRGMVVTCRDVHLRETGEKDCWSALRAIGADGVEVLVAGDLSLPSLAGPEGPYSIADDAAIGRLAADLKAREQRITAFCMENRFEERPEFEIEWVTKTARAAAALGVPAIRIDVVARKRKGYAFLRFAIELGGRLLEATESTGVALGVENHGGTTNDPEFLKALFGGVGAKRFGLTLDTANFYWFGHPLSSLYGIYEALAPRVCHTHAKSIRYPAPEREKRRPMGWEYGRYCCPVDEGDIDFERVVGILRSAGYRNDLCIEDESLGKAPAKERKAVLERQVRFLRGLL